MMQQVVKLDWTDMTEAIPAFIAIMAMPFLYSISEGISLGIISYVVLHLLTGKTKKISPLMYVLAVVFILKYIRPEYSLEELTLQLKLQYFAYLMQRV